MSLENENMELAEYICTFKRNIAIMVEKGRLAEAEELIKKYESYIGTDIDMYSPKAAIAIAKDDLELAEKILMQGLGEDDNNFELLYTMAKLYQRKSQPILAIQYLKKAMPNAKDEASSNKAYRLLHQLECAQTEHTMVADAQAKTSIIILTYNNLEYNKLCLKSIRTYTRPGSYEIIVVDNHSTDGTVQWLQQQEDLKLIINADNLGFPKGCNQGMLAATTGNDILLLNNDVVVTPNWLDNLRTCLYNREEFGAVGAVTNSCSNYQTIPAGYNNLDEMVGFAQKNNQSDKSLWEERVRLVAFCLLIKAEVVKQVGLLDEIFSPGNFEDDDYSLRIRKAGYRLILCRDSFVHHFGSASFGKVAHEYNDLLVENRKKFMQKWGFDPQYIAVIDHEITEMVARRTCGNNEKLLHIGCAGGGTLLNIKNRVPSIELYGLAPISQAIVDTEHFADITPGTIKQIKTVKNTKFDFVIITQKQDKSKDLLALGQSLLAYLTVTGRIYVALADEMHSLNREFVKDFETKVKGCSAKVVRVGDQKVLIIENMRRKEDAGPIRIKSLSRDELAGKVARLRQLMAREDDGCDDTINTIRRFANDKVSLLNALGVLFYQAKENDKALRYFRESFKVDPRNAETIYNLAFIMHEAGQDEAAVNFLLKVNRIEKIRAEQRSAREANEQ